MILDKLVQFADSVSTGDSTGTNVVGDVINLQDVRDIGSGHPVYLTVLVTGEVTAGTDGTYAVALTSGTDENLSNPRDHIVSGEFDSASGLDAGTVLLNVAIPAEGDEYQQYLGIREVVGTAGTTAGSVSAFLSHDRISYKAYAQAEV